MRIRCNDDKLSIQESDVEKIVRKICVSYAHLRRSFLSSYAQVNKELDQGNVTAAVEILIRVFKFPVGFCKRIGFNTKGLPETAVASMLLQSVGNKSRPFSGTLLFVQDKQTVIKVPRYRLIHIIAHEFSHARLFLDLHELCESEFATDTLALLVTGDADGFAKNMQSLEGVYGYIRPDLYPALFRAMKKYSEVVYLRYEVSNTLAEWGQPLFF